jgi:hypothetical protein
VSGEDVDVAEGAELQKVAIASHDEDNCGVMLTESGRQIDFSPLGSGQGVFAHENVS